MASLEAQEKAKPPLWRGLAPLIVIAVLASHDGVVNAYGEICKPIALLLLGVFGFVTSDHGSYLSVAQLEVPWTRDCAGMNLLLVLLAVFAWMNRNIQQDVKYWLRMVAVILPAIAANVLRVITLVFYRFMFYPEVESPQLHYFFGFIWLIPFALISIPRHSERTKKAFWFELLHISAIIGLLAPLLGLSEHWITAMGVLFCMLHTNFADSFYKRHILMTALWGAFAVVIAWAGIESLWLPWLLVSPLTIDFKWIRSPVGIGCLVTACPLFVLLPGAQILASVIFATVIIKWYMAQQTNTGETKIKLSYGWERVLTAVCAPLLFFPFLAAIVFSANLQKIVPPDNIQRKVIEGMGYELRLEGQPKNLGLIWYDALGSDRHHTVEVCLKYRGIELKSSEVTSVKTDGTHWYCEFFIVENHLLADHQSYVRETLGFRQNPGVHLIIVAKNDDVTAEDFAEQAKGMASQLHHSLGSST